MALWIVATPIGTLDDGSIRARRVLGEVSAIYCEDTRRVRQLLTAWEIPAPRLEALHAHNEDARAEAVAAHAAEADVALVSDAGTPGVSDPGRAVVAACLASGVEVRSVPGPSALATALAASGMPAAPSTFLGFPPRKGRKRWAADVLARPETLVMYEAPGRAPGLVADLARHAPEREAALCRELSKKFEEVRRAPLGELAASLAEQPPRGECVLVVAPSGVPAARAATPAAEVAGDASLKDVAAALAARWGIKKRDAYQALLALQERLRA